MKVSSLHEQLLDNEDPEVIRELNESTEEPLPEEEPGKKVKWKSYWRKVQL